MATATQVSVAPELTSYFRLKQPAKDSPQRATELLQENHDKHHIYFNDAGFHNHIVHHLLAIYSLGASPAALEAAYKHNLSYQRSLNAPSSTLPAELIEYATFHKYLGNGRYYSDYLKFFANEIASKGNEAVIQEYVLAGDARADDMLVRLYNGVLHPIIHLGYGLEFSQPAIIAEALAQAATHSNSIGALFYDAEAKAKQDSASNKTLVALAKEARATDKLRFSVSYADGDKISNGVLKNALDEITTIAAQWTVSPEKLETKFAELIAFCALMTLGAQKPPHAVKMDFFLLHAINACTLLHGILNQSWLTSEQRCRLLEWKGRYVLALYVARGSPELLYEEIRQYKPIRPEESSWDQVIERANGFVDDGHTSKLIRALGLGEKLCGDHEDEEWCVLKRQDWLMGANMVIDSVQWASTTWVREAGFDEAWASVPLRD